MSFAMAGASWVLGSKREQLIWRLPPNLASQTIKRPSTLEQHRPSPTYLARTLPPIPFRTSSKLLPGESRVTDGPRVERNRWDSLQ